MKLDRMSLPHPILRKFNSEVSGRFETQVTIAIDRAYVKISVQNILHNEEIQELIARGKAVFFVDISCPATLFRKGISIPDDRLQDILIESKDLRDTVTVTCLIVAIEVIPEYENSYTNSFFEGRTFSIEKGEVLAFSGSDTFEVDKLWETPGSKGAFFMWDQHSGKDVKYELGIDPILIKLPREDYEIMRTIKRNKNLKNIFLSLYVYPAMLYVVGEYFSERSDTYNLRKWHKKLTDLLKEAALQKIGASAEKVPELVQEIFSHPLSKSIRDLKNISDKFSD